jgi:hypothetical protein
MCSHRVGDGKHDLTCHFASWAVLGSNQRPLRCKRRSTQVSWQRRCGISQVVSLIRHQRRLPSMAADCPRPRSSRGPDGQRSSRISIRGGDIVKRGNARQLLINDIRLREQTYIRTRGWRARTRIYLSRAFHGLATERQQSLAPPNSHPRICAETFDRGLLLVHTNPAKSRSTEPKPRAATI